MVNLTVGKSFRLRTPSPVKRILLGSPGTSMAAKPQERTSAVGQPPAPAAAPATGGVAAVDVILLGPNEIYLQGRSVGSTNLILLGRSGLCTLLDVAVGVDASTLQSALDQMMPMPGHRVQVTSAADSLILTGSVANAPQVDRVVTLASAYTSKVVNLINVADPQQVMLEVKVAEVSRTLLDELGVRVNFTGGGQWTYNLLSQFLSLGSGSLRIANAAGTRVFDIDAEKQDGLVKMLAEPTVMALSGQEGSFLAGGRIFIPVAQSGGLGSSSSTITLEEKEFGVGLKFTPTVLDGGRINLVVAPEVSELSPTGVTISGSSLFGSSVIPFLTTRRAKTTVQLMDGQSLAIGGLIKNNQTQNIRAFPLLGEIPILGALFRSSNFRTDKSELLFVITPRLVKPLPADYKLPTDNFIPPSRAEFFLGGKMEGAHSSAPADTNQPAPAATAAAPSGFEVK
jgi:pilus assembly protein CpaC